MAEYKEIKRWLKDLRVLVRIRVQLIWDIDVMKNRHESIYSAAQLCYGRDVNAGIHASNTSDPTGNSVANTLQLFENNLRNKCVALFQLEEVFSQALQYIENCLLKPDESDVTEREAVKYYYLEAMSEEEVAQLTNYDVRSVERKKASGIKKLKEYAKTHPMPSFNLSYPYINKAKK